MFSYPFLNAILLVPLLGLASVFILVLIYRYPEWSLISIYLLRPFFELARLTPWEDQVTQWIIGPLSLLITLTMFLVLILRNKLFSWDNSYILGFIGVTIFIALFNGANFGVIDIIVRIIAPLVLLIFPQLFIKDDRQVRRFLHIIAYSTVIVLIALLLDFDRTNMNPYGWIQGQVEGSTGELVPRMAAVFGVPTVTAFWLFQFFAVTYLFFSFEKGAKRFAWFAVMMIILFGIYKTYCRGAWVSCVFLPVAYNCLQRKYLLGSILGIMILLIPILLPDIILRISDPITILGRLYWWYGYLEAMMRQGSSSWFLGLGWADIVAGNIYSVSPIEGVTGLVENSFIFMFAGSGLIPLLLLLMIFLNLSRQALWLVEKGDTQFSRSYGAWGLSLLGSWFIMSMSGDMLTYTVINWYYYIYFGWLSALFALKTQKYSACDDRKITLVNPFAIKSIQY